MSPAFQLAAAAKTGVRPSLENSAFEVTLMFAFQPTQIFSCAEMQDDFGMTQDRVYNVLSRLARENMVERVGRGQYRASAALRRMVAMHAPRSGV